MQTKPCKTSRIPRWIAYFLMALAAVAAYLFVNTDAEIMKPYHAGSFGLLLGAALLLFGLEEFNDRKIRGVRVYVHRDATPLIFFLLLAGKRLLHGITMIGAGFRHVFSKLN